jgi:UDP-glucose 4-epimerase
VLQAELDNINWGPAHSSFLLIVIGSYVVHDLIGQGHRVTILARNPAKVAGFLDVPGIDFVEGTLTDRAAIRRALDGKDACIHIALGWGDTATDMAQADTVPSLFIFDEAVRAGVSRIIYTSSIAAFGDPRPLFGESTAPRPTDFYGATKAAAEAYLLAVGATHDVAVTVIRPGYTFGEPVVPGATIYTDEKLPTLVAQAKRNETISVTKDHGTQFIWAGDLSQVYSAVLASSATRRLYTSVSADFTTWEQVARMAIEHCGSTSQVILTDPVVDRGMGLNDVSPIEDDFGLRFSSRKRLREHIAWLADAI